MVQNRNKLIGLLIGNISNAIVHEILEKAVSSKPEISIKYKKEIRAFRVEKGRKFNLDPLNTIIKATKLWMRSFNLKSRLLKSSRMPIKIIKREQIR